ncbi:MAG: Hsp70 family protein [Microthrixaceae bacterium]
MRQASIDDAVLMTEPEAAALHYGGLQRVAPGESVAVYDFGGGTFDSAVLMASDVGFSLAGTPEGIERLGGDDFDQAILSHVNAAPRRRAVRTRSGRPHRLGRIADLRDSCRAAKEALSEDTDATITVNLPGRPSTALRITRAQFEELISPRIDATIDALERTILSAGRATGDITRILPVGGSSRIPLVHQRIREATGRPLSFDADPNLAIAQGAAALARQVSANNAGAAPTPAPTAAQVATAGPPAAPSGRRPVLVGAACVGVIAVIALAATMLLGGDDSIDAAGIRCHHDGGACRSEPVVIDSGEELDNDGPRRDGERRPHRLHRRRRTLRSLRWPHLRDRTHHCRRRGRHHRSPRDQRDGQRALHRVRSGAPSRRRPCRDPRRRRAGNRLGRDHVGRIRARVLEFALPDAVQPVPTRWPEQR